MITRIEAFVGKVRRLFNRSEWAIRLLRLKKIEHGADTFGLVLIQIDGLSLKQFERAKGRGNLPFLKSLQRRESYSVRTFYSGIPSNTPAVQAELFYGVRTAVPAFCYLDRASGNVLKMYDKASAKLVEARLREAGPGLLKGGSSYCNIFSGGADEAHFCADNNGWRAILHAANPMTLPFLILCYLDIFIRCAFLMVVEFFLAVFDCVRGTTGWTIFRKEFEFIFTRVMVCILMRELIVAGVAIDIARGLPVIHANFIGYDDQSHRRGPSSAFAHWSLKGIDHSIRRIARAAEFSDRRAYDLWVYSDHGQEKTISYPMQYGVTLEDAVRKIFGQKTEKVKAVLGERNAGRHEWRAELLEDREEAESKNGSNGPKIEEIVIAAMGPVGHIYVSQKLTEAEYDEYARRLVAEARIPLVMHQDPSGVSRAWTDKGSFVLPDGGGPIFGTEHPFAEEGAQDLALVCAHPDAGDFVVMGWSSGHTPMSFPIETGAHAGIGPEETQGFALLPRDVPLDTLQKPYLRPSDLRGAVQRFLGSDLFRFYSAPRLASAPAKTLSIMTYNVHGCVGMDDRLNIDRIARVIARHGPDIVALQEVDVGRSRSHRMDQAEMIAQKLEMKYHYHPTFRIEDETHGNAIFSRFPMSVVKMDELPGFYARKGQEVRGAIWINVDANGFKFQLINTHLSIWPFERLLQAKAIAGANWLSHPDCSGPVIVCGDFNAQPRTPAYRHMCTILRDSQRSLPKHRPSRTWSGKYGISRIDHVFLSKEWEVQRVEVPRSQLDRIASDHLPLIVRLKIHAEPGCETV